MKSEFKKLVDYEIKDLFTKITALNAKVDKLYWLLIVNLLALLAHAIGIILMMHKLP